MVTRLSTTFDLMPLLVVGWQVVFPAAELRILSGALLVIATVAIARLVSREFRSKARRIVILGSGPMAAKLIDEMESSVNPRYVIVGIVDDHEPEEGTPEADRWVGRSDQLSAVVEQLRPETIVVAVADRRAGLPMESLLESRVRGVEVEDAVDFYERLTGKIAIEALRPSMLILSKGFRNHGAPEVTARVVSVVAAAFGLLLVAPLLLAIALIVKLDSRGPVFFIQQRAGKNGRPFGLLKFRTMHPATEAHSEWVQDNTHRITRVGKWLRRFRLDELPQLVNMLRGEMNLVGPRPHPTSNHQVFMENIAYYGLRSTVRPGMTGWAQVKYGYANNLEEETEKMRYDLYYIKNRSLWLDTRILFASVAVILFGQGATEVRKRTPALPIRATRVPVREPRREPQVAPMPVPVLAGSATARPTAGQS